jgi:hypothetical protein
MKNVKELCRSLRTNFGAKFEGSTMGALAVGHEPTATAIADLINSFFTESARVAHGVQIGDPLPPYGTSGGFIWYLIVAPNLLRLEVKGEVNRNGNTAVSKVLEILPLARLDEVRVLVPAGEPPKVSLRFRDQPEAIEITPGAICLGDASAEERANFVARFAAAAIRARG